MPMLKRHLIACLMLLSAVLGAAEEVGKVRFEQHGGSNVPDEMLQLNLWLRPGREFSQKRLDEDIKRLYETGSFTDVEAVIKKPEEGKVDVTFVLQNTPKISEITISGNQKYKTENLLELVTIEAKTPLNDNKLRESASAIRKKYYDNGFYESKVNPKVSKNPDGSVKVNFDIQENLRLKVNSVKFTGNTAFSAWAMKDVIATAHSYLNWIMEWGLVNDDEVQKDIIRLRNLYWTKGYLDFAAKPEITKLADDPDYADVTFHITEGEPYKVSKVEINGGKAVDRARLLAGLSLKAGEVYNVAKQDKDVLYIKNQFAPLGYCDFKCDPVLSSDFATHTVAVTYHIKEGGAFTVHDVNISGNRIVKDYVLRREVPLQPGDPVNTNLVDVGKSRLMGMNYFEKVDSYTTASGVDDQKNINYDVKEKGTAHVSVGAGWSSDESLVGRLELSETDLDITDPRNWFRGAGQRVDLVAEVGILKNALALSFTEPWLFNIPLRLDTTAFINTRKYDYWSERHGGLDIGLTKPVFSDFNTVNFGYVIDFVKVSDMDHRYSESFRDKNEGEFRRGAFRLGFTRDTRDSVMNPTSGYELSALGEINSELTGATANYYRAEAKASGYWNFLEKMLVLHLGTKVGQTSGFGGDAPFFERYFMGGQENLRGFAYRRVSPLNNERMPLGGGTMFLVSSEITHPIYKWVRGAVFVDAGDCWQDPASVRPDLNVGVGYGLRIMVPQLNYPIKVDFALPVHRTNHKFSDSLQFYFNVGFNW